MWIVQFFNNLVSLLVYIFKLQKFTIDNMYIIFK
jgi:hypothetical protein